MTLKSQSQKFQLIKGLVSNKSKFEKVLDEFNSLAIEDDVNEEREKNEEKAIQRSSVREVPSSVHHVSSLKQVSIQKPQAVGYHHQASPSISNKIPSSLAFRIKSHEHEESQVVNSFGDSLSPSKRIRLFKGDVASLGNTRQLFEDDQNPLSTRRLGNAGELTNFSLRDKDELNRNIPFTKFINMDFSGIANKRLNNSPSKFEKYMIKRSPSLLLRKESLNTVTLFLDFETLMKVMSLTKAFREGFTNRPTHYQLDIAKIFKTQLRSLLILGLSSTI